MLIRRTDAEAEAPILWPPDAKSQLTGKDPDAVTESSELEGSLDDHCSIAINRPDWRKGKFALF